MISFKEMSQLMNDNVLKALWRFFYEFEIQPNPFRLDIAGAPFGLHSLDSPLRKINGKGSSPCFHQGQSARAQLAAIPVLEHALSSRQITAGSHVQVQRPAIADVNTTSGCAINGVQAIALAEKKMALTRYIGSLRLPRLRIELSLLTFDPAHARDDSEADGFVADTHWGSDPHTPIGRVNTKMQVLDRLSDHIDIKSAHPDLMPFSTHADFGPDQRLQRQERDQRYVP